MRALEFPTTRRDPNSGYTLHGRRFGDPYSWLERLDDPEAQAWIAAQEAVTHAVLRAVPGRDWLRAEVARAARYARLSPPIPAGPDGREFLWQAHADDDKLKFMLRKTWSGSPSWRPKTGARGWRRRIARRACLAQGALKRRIVEVVRERIL